jgi:hypothetical protein
MPDGLSGDPSFRASVRELYGDQGLGPSEVAKRLNASVGQVNRAIDAMAIRRRKQGATDVWVRDALLRAQRTQDEILAEMRAGRTQMDRLLTQVDRILDMLALGVEGPSGT